MKNDRTLVLQMDYMIHEEGRKKDFIANCCNYPSFHFTCLSPDRFVLWHLATSQWSIFYILYMAIFWIVATVGNTIQVMIC